VDFGVYGGISAPMGDFGDAADAGFHVGGQVEFGLMAVPLAVRGDLAFNQFGITDFDESFRIIYGTVSAVYDLVPGPARIYLLGGLGLYNLDVTGVDVDSETEFGISIGAGAEFGLGQLRGFAEAKFKNVFTEGDNLQFIPLSVGVRF
jgi:opacity protein-like surface antigen